MFTLLTALELKLEELIITFIRTYVSAFTCDFYLVRRISFPILKENAKNFELVSSFGPAEI
jgi:hypothetical protein